MQRKLLGICGVVLFGLFGTLSGALAGPVPVVHGGGVEAETCNACVSTCAHMHDMMMRDCANTRKYRTKTQQTLCRGAAMREYGDCLADCDHKKK